MNMDQLPHVCECEACQADLRIAVALEHADKYYELRKRQTEAAKAQVKLATVIRFPVEKRFSNGER